MSQKRALSHVISFSANYRLFAHSDVSYRFSGKCDNVVLEFSVKVISVFDNINKLLDFKA